MFKDLFALRPLQVIMDKKGHDVLHLQKRQFHPITTLYDTQRLFIINDNMDRVYPIAIDSCKSFFKLLQQPAVKLHIHQVLPYQRPLISAEHSLT